MTAEAATMPQRRGPEDAMTALSSLLDQAEADHPDRHALRLDDLVPTCAHLRAAGGQMATLLASHGIAPGERAGIMLPNVPALLTAFHGVLASGAVAAPVNPLLKGREVACCLGDSGARAVLLAWHAAARGAAGAGTQAITVVIPGLADLLAGQDAGTAQAAGDNDAARTPGPSRQETTMVMSREASKARKAAAWVAAAALAVTLWGGYTRG